MALDQLTPDKRINPADITMTQVLTWPWLAFKVSQRTGVPHAPSAVALAVRKMGKVVVDPETGREGATDETADEMAHSYNIAGRFYPHTPPQLKGNTAA
jgi:hypothetical protein